MEIRNEGHARSMLEEWQGLPLASQKREIRIAIEKLELSIMYYELKDNQKGMDRANSCIRLLAGYLKTID